MKNVLRYFPAWIVLLMLILIGTILRFCCYSSFSFSNDELSAIFRAHFPSFMEMIQQGVYPDFHPAGVEIFLYYWIKCAGTSESMIRLPFVMMGILTIPLAYLIGKQWFGRVSGLFFAASLSFLQFPLLFSQIARPYSSGLFLCLLMVVFWNNMVFPVKKKSPYPVFTIAGYAISTAACAYNHYFCGLMAIIVGITGLFLLRKENLKPYLLSLFISMLLFAPHIPVSLSHFSKGGVGEWLGKPENDWIQQHLFYLFNESWFFIFVALVVFILSLTLNSKNLKFTKFHLISLLWFLLPLTIGFFYSRWINPVLQHSVLLFSSPFLLLFMVSCWKDNWNGASAVVLFIYTLSGITDTVFIQQYYSRQHFGEFRDIAARIHEWNERYGTDQVKQVIVVNNPYYINLYFNRLDKHYEFEQYDNRGGRDLLDLVKIVENSQSPYFIAAWTKPAPDEIDAIIQSRYHCVSENIDYDGLSGIRLYTKKLTPGLACVKDSADYEIINNFEGKDNWGIDPVYISDRFSTSGSKGIALDSTTAFGPTYQIDLQDIPGWPVSTIRISVSALIAEEGCDAQLVADLTTTEGNSYGWASGNFNNFLEINKKGKVFFTYTIPREAKGRDKLKVYIWNNGLKKVYADDMIIKFYRKGDGKGFPGSGLFGV